MRVADDHPVTGARIAGEVLPHWAETVQMACAAHGLFPQLGAIGWDIAITLIFDSMDDVRAYIVDPDHRTYVDDFASPKIEVRKAWNFEI